MKGQISTETLIIIGFVIFLFIPLLFFLYFRTSQLNAELSITQAHFYAHRLASLVESVGNSGDGSAIKTTIYLPKGYGVEITSHEILFTVELQEGKTDVSVPVEFNTISSLTFTEGYNYIKIENRDGVVYIE